MTGWGAGGKRFTQEISEGNHLQATHMMYNYASIFISAMLVRQSSDRQFEKCDLSRNHLSHHRQHQFGKAKYFMCIPVNASHCHLWPWKTSIHQVSCSRAVHTLLMMIVDDPNFIVLKIIIPCTKQLQGWSLTSMLSADVRPTWGVLRWQPRGRWVQVGSFELPLFTMLMCDRSAVVFTAWSMQDTAIK